MPSSVHEVYKPWAYDVRKDWYRRHGSDLREMVKNAAGYRRKHRDTVVLGESAFHEQAYGTVWETCEPCGQWPTGWRPMDPDEELDMFLNYDYFAQEMPDYDDQELLWMLRHGATMKAYLPYQTVLVPHLLSLKNGCAYIFDEMVKLKERGWYAFNDDFLDRPPTAPEKLTARGATPRANEPLRPRPTSDGGMPRDEVTS